MPYSNPYSTSLPGLEEARLDAIKTAITDSLADLNTSQKRSPLAFLPDWTSAQIVLGDPETLLSSLICIVAGGKDDATDIETGADINVSGHILQPMPWSDTGGFYATVSTNIYVYLHPDVCKKDDALIYVANMERWRTRVCDHLRKRVFNAVQNATLFLSSQESGGADQLTECHLVRTRKAVFNKNCGGGTTVMGAHMLHTGKYAR